MDEHTPYVDVKLGDSTPAADAGNGSDIPSSVKQIGYLSILPGSDHPLPDEITEQLLSIQKLYPSFPLWVIMHDGEEGLGELGTDLWAEIYRCKNDLNKDEPILLLCVSPGGDAEVAYRIAKLINNKCGAFSILIPQQGKSAATLLALGAEEILIGTDGDLGPLDVQIGDMNEERMYSALDEVKSIDDLFEFANVQVLNTAFMWSRALNKKKQSVFPFVTEYVSNMMKPLMEKIDTVHYMSLSRTLRIAQEYAFRLLQPKYGIHQAKVIARRFVEDYPYHGFIIDKKEAEGIGLQNISLIPENLQGICDELVRLTNDCQNYLIGKFSSKDSI